MLASPRDGGRQARTGRGSRCSPGHPAVARAPWGEQLWVHPGEAAPLEQGEMLARLLQPRMLSMHLAKKGPCGAAVTPG